MAKKHRAHKPVSKLTHDPTRKPPRRDASTPKVERVNAEPQVLTPLPPHNPGRERLERAARNPPPMDFPIFKEPPPGETGRELTGAEAAAALAAGLQSAAFPPTPIGQTPVLPKLAPSGRIELPPADPNRARLLRLSRQSEAGQLPPAPPVAGVKSAPAEPKEQPRVGFFANVHKVQM